MIYKANKPTKLTYVTKDGEKKSIDFTPEKDMNRPQIITMLRDQDDSFLKLLEGDKKMGKHYIKLESTFKKPKEAENVTDDVSYIVLQDSTADNIEDSMMDILVFKEKMSDEDFEKMKSIVEKVKSDKPEDYTVDDIVDAINNEFNVTDHMEVSNSKAMYIYY